jgi:hypothetical protein
LVLSRFSFFSGVVVGLQRATASWTVRDSLTALRNVHSSVLVIRLMVGVTGALGPLWMVLPLLCMHRSFTAGFLRSAGSCFNAWSFLAAMSQTAAVRKCRP